MRYIWCSANSPSTRALSAARRLETAAERLLDDDARPRPLRRRSACAAPARSSRDAARSARTRSAERRDRTADCAPRPARRARSPPAACRRPRTSSAFVEVAPTRRTSRSQSCSPELVVDALDLVGLRRAPRACASRKSSSVVASSRPTPSTAKSSCDEMLAASADRSPAAACARLRSPERAEDHHRARIGALRAAAATGVGRARVRRATELVEARALMSASPRGRRTRCAARR